ncbi:MAG: thioredoxin domain-containing protein [Halorubrum sp.]
MTHTRRSLLAGVAAGGTVGVTGCLGGDNSGPGDTGAFDCELAEPVTPDATFRAAIGDPDADVVVQVFEDFTCGHCATYKLDHFPVIREEYIDPGQIRYEHWDFPIPVDEDWAHAVASAARGVGVRQGDEAFFGFTARIYESYGSYDLEAIGEAAEAVGDDPCAAMADAYHESAHGALEADREAGVARGVDGTPTVIVDDAPVAGYDADDIAAAIDASL